MEGIGEQISRPYMVHLQNSNDENPEKVSIQPEEQNLHELMEYYGYKGEIGKIQFYFRVLVSWILQSLAKASPHSGLTVFLQKARGVKIGKHVYIGPGVQIDDLYPRLINIQDYVSIGMHCMIFAHSNPTCSKELKKKYYPRKVAPVVISKGAWVAPGCIILCGVTIGENSVIGAGSVVVKDVEPLSVVAGNPPRLIKHLDKLDKP
jgi:acetyltransferase-like isoleucine patch superfamily enzyme